MAKKTRLLPMSFDASSEAAKRAVLDRRNQQHGEAWEITTWRDYDPGPSLPFRAWLIAVALIHESRAISVEHDLVLNAGNYFIIVPNIRHIACLEYEEKHHLPDAGRILAHRP